MSTEFRLPKLAEGDATGSVAKVLVQPGDALVLDQSILEVETDKAVVEVPATIAGTVTAVHVKAGEDVSEGTLILTVAEAAASPAADPPASPEPAPTAAPQAPPAPPAAPHQAAQPPAAAQAPVASPPVPPAAPAPGRSRIPAAPSVRRFARELGVDLAAVDGSGPAGRISLQDVKAYVRTRETASVGAPSALPALPDFSRFGPVRREPVSAVRRATAQHLGQSWPNVPQVTQFDAADVTELERLRRLHGPLVAERGGKLTVTAVLLKVVALALRKYPKFNASLDLAKGEVVYKEYMNIGIAVDTPRGLLVPVVRDVDRKSIADLSVELNAIAEKSRTAKLSLDDLQGGCFSISNLGGIGGTGFTPIVNSPEVVILGVSRTAVEPRWDGSAFLPRDILPLSLSYDHRLIDGADAARFLRYVCEVVESPFLLALEG
ncbi:MAG: 2-oxo acid dehydrogenase subunit E2 [Thermaerobacter sp.]|nr:2-oxo acid dehydrogenase subunit E2 [Thermaerobacter sp.]